MATILVTSTLVALEISGSGIKTHYTDPESQNQHKNKEVKNQEKMSSQQLDQNVIDNLESIESEIETSSLYFKPKSGKNYVIRIDPQNKIVPVETDRFKDANGKPLKRYETKITHVNNGKEQLWDTSKTVCLQIIEQPAEKLYSFEGDSERLR